MGFGGGKEMELVVVCTVCCFEDWFFFCSSFSSFEGAWTGTQFPNCLNNPDKQSLS